MSSRASMNIALCKSHFAGPVSGADEVLTSYAITLHEAGHDVQVVLLYKCDEDDNYYARLKRAGVPVVSVISRSITFMLLRKLRHLLASVFFFIFLVPQSSDLLQRAWQRLLNLLSHLHYRKCLSHLMASRPDVMHVFTPDSGAELLMRAGHELGIPVIYHELGTPHHLPTLNVHYRQLEKTLPLCTEVSALSPRLAAQWSERFPFLKSVSVMPLLVADCQNGNGRRQSTPYGETVFGFAARLEEGKGPGVLISALSELNRDRLLGRLRMAGIGPQLAQLKATTRKLEMPEACEFVGHYSQPLGRDAFMRSLDVFVLPSFAEGTPNCIIEAMAHGLPVIASDVGGIPDLVSEDSGILVTPGDHEALALAMRRMATDPELRTRMGQAARERYLRLFSPQAVLPVLRSTYLRVASTHCSSPPAVHSDCDAHPPHPWDIVPEF